MPAYILGFISLEYLVAVVTGQDVFSIFRLAQACVGPRLVMHISLRRCTDYMGDANSNEDEKITSS